MTLLAPFPPSPMADGHKIETKLAGEYLAIPAIAPKVA